MNNSSLPTVIIAKNPPAQNAPVMFIAKLDETLYNKLVEKNRKNPQQTMNWIRRNLSFTFAGAIQPITQPSTVLEEIEYYYTKVYENPGEFYAARYFLATNSEPSPEEENYCFFLQLNYSRISSLGVFFDIPRNDFLEWMSKEESKELLKQSSNSLML